MKEQNGRIARLMKFRIIIGTESFKSLKYTSCFSLLKRFFKKLVKEIKFMVNIITIIFPKNNPAME